MHAGFPSNREKLQSWLLYYEDLGIRTFYRDRAPSQTLMDEAVTGMREKERTEVSTPKAAPPPQSRAAAPKLNLTGRAPSLFEIAERVEGDSLELICGQLAGCTRCKLHQRRTNVVFGVGNPHAELVFVGEGPGHDEDIQGIPFVGRAGQLLTQMILAMGLKRDDVYIANVVKCRPPENRAPEKDEIATCLPFLFRQLTNINPKVIVCL